MSRYDKDYIVSYLPGPAEEEYKKAFEGWTIVEMQFCGRVEDFSKTFPNSPYPRVGSVEGGLTFVLERDSVRKRIILGYTELGEWIEDERELTPELVAHENEWARKAAVGELATRADALAKYAKG